MVEANSSAALSLSATWNETSSNGTFRGSHQIYVTSLYLAAYCAVFLLSIVGNVAVVIMVLKISKNGGTRACCFIFNLVMCDLLVGIFCVPFTLIQDLLTDGGLADLMCKMTSTVQGIAVCCSVFTLTTVAILRYRWREHQQQMEISGTTVLVVSIAMWVVAILFSSPELVVRRTIEPDPELGGKLTCTDTWPSSQLKMVYKGFLFALCFLGPFFVIGYLWVTVGINTCCASREQPGVVIERSQSPSASPARQKGTKYFRMLKIIVAIFCFLWLPLYVSWTLEAYGDYSWFLKEKVKGYIYPIALWTAFSNSLINPFICGYYTKNFGKMCKKKPRRSWQARKNWENSLSSNNSSSDGKASHIELNSVCGSTEKADDDRGRILVLPTDKDVILEPVGRLPTDCSTEPLTRTEVKE
ncbi:PREDICTED: neuropeptide FF receptor 2-like [Branchiostoma belcheri]|uniref:Neuropeptide FF receptor 2-like n=1 Tax=Branchiostoma belcheri TaxID=7741 RepID=A0A6P4YRP4_BRABE|nr:PREDICTED: neuropeptide FF receptor 2-like [Branchiostoma belcheri]